MLLMRYSLKAKPKYDPNSIDRFSDEIISKLDSPPGMITLDKLSIVEIVDDIASWKVLYSYPLIKKSNVRLTLGRPV